MKTIDVLKLTHLETRGRRIELDMLRGVAIIAVMGAHFQTVDSGYRAIDAFEFFF